MDRQLDSQRCVLARKQIMDELERLGDCSQVPEFAVKSAALYRQRVEEVASLWTVDCQRCVIARKDGPEQCAISPRQVGEDLHGGADRAAKTLPRLDCYWAGGDVAVEIGAPGILAQRNHIARSRRPRQPCRRRPNARHRRQSPNPRPRRRLQKAESVPLSPKASLSAS